MAERAKSVQALQSLRLPGALPGASAHGPLPQLKFTPASLQALRGIHAREPVTETGLGKPKSAGDKVLSGLKSLGEGALDTLSIPQASLFTLTSKFADAIGQGKGNPMDWSDMLGYWSDDYKGFSELVEQGGHDPNNPWMKALSIGMDVAADPLWFVAPAKVNKAKKTAEAVEKLAEGGVKAKGIAAVEEASRPAKSAVGKLKDQGFTVTRNRPIKVPEDASGDMGIVDATGEALRVVKGDIIAGESGLRAIVQTRRASRKAGGEKAEYKVFDVVEEDGVYTLVNKGGTGSYPNKTAAMEDIANRADPERLIDLDPVTGLPPVERINSNVGKLEEAARRRHEPGNLGIKFGVGKPNPAGGKGKTGLNYTVRTPVPYPGLPIGSLGAFRGTTEDPKKGGLVAGLASLFNKSPAEALAHRIATAGREQSQAVRSVVDRGMRADLRASIAQRTGLAGDDLERATDEAARIITLVAQADAVDPKDWAYVGRNFPEGTEPRAVGQIVRQMLMEEGRWTREMEDILQAMRKRFAENRANPGAVHSLGSVDLARGPYFPQGATSASIKEGRKAAEEAGELGRRGMFSGKGVAKGDIDSELARRYDSAFAWKTEDEWRKTLVEDMGLSPELADDIVKNLSARLDELDSTPYWQTRKDKGGSGVSMKPEDAPTSTFALEMDAFNIFTMKEQSDIATRVRLQIEQMLVDLKFVEAVPRRKGLAVADAPESVITRDSKVKATSDAAQRVVDAALARPRMAGLEGTLSNNEFGFALMNMISHLKNFLTTPWPRHYVNNAFGDFFNALVRGNWRHLASQPKANVGKVNRVGSMDDIQKTGAKGDKFFRLAAEDKRALADTYELFGKTYTGEEVLALSHMMGLGKGFVGEDIGSFLHLVKEPKTWYGKYSHYMKRQNMNREEAARLSNWVKHMESGDEPFEAMYKTLDGIFDYGDLTNFEMIWMRNTLMFYTWMRKNTAFQLKAMFKKPGLYSAYGDMEFHRPKDMFEPEYLKEMGLLWVPGLGSIYVGLPAADLHRLPTVWTTDPGDFMTGLRNYLQKDIGGSLNPLAKVPVEMALNKSFFTGGPIESYEGQLKRSPLGALAQYIPGLGVEGYANQAAKEAGVKQTLMPAWPAYLLEQISPIGQVGSQIQRADAALSGEKGLSSIDALSAIVGLKRVPDNSVEWERNAAYQAAKRKAEETRRKNQRGEK